MTTLTYPVSLEQRLGIFARAFKRGTASEVAQAVAGAGYDVAHWNFAAVGKSTLGVDVTDVDVTAVRAAFDAVDVSLPSVSCTYNMAHPDAVARHAWTEQAVRFIGMVAPLGVDVITLCTGTRTAKNMWKAHPDNTTRSAWADLRASLEPLLQAASDAGVLLGVEPEHANVIHDAPTARRLLDELGDGAPIGIILDPANLLSPETIPHQEEILTNAVELLGDRVIGAQAKDVVESGYSGPGAGMMDYHGVFRALVRIAPVPLIVQDASEEDAPRVRANLLRWEQEMRR